MIMIIIMIIVIMMIKLSFDIDQFSLMESLLVKHPNISFVQVDIH